MVLFYIDRVNSFDKMLELSPWILMFASYRFYDKVILTVTQVSSCFLVDVLPTDSTIKSSGLLHRSPPVLTFVCWCTSKIIWIVTQVSSCTYICLWMYFQNYLDCYTGLLLYLRLSVDVLPTDSTIKLSGLLHRSPPVLTFVCWCTSYRLYYKIIWIVTQVSSCTYVCLLMYFLQTLL